MVFHKFAYIVLKKLLDSAFRMCFSVQYAVHLLKQLLKPCI